MAQITNVKFLQSGEQVVIFSDSTQTTVPVGSRGQDRINNWVADGNVISPFDPYEGRTLNQAKTRKKRDIRLRLRRLLREHVHPHQMDKLVDNTTVPGSVITYKSDLGTVRTDSIAAIDAATTKLEVLNYEPTLPTPPNA